MNRTPHTDTTTTDPAPRPNTAEAASLYQRLRSHLAVLKLHDAAEPSRACSTTPTATG